MQEAGYSEASRSGYYEIGGGLVHINAGPGAVIVRKEESAGLRWCFNRGCRAHLLHTWELLDYDVPSYYEPWWVCRCSRCGEDHTEFPG